MATASKTDRDLKKFSRDLTKLFSSIESKKEMIALGNDSIDIIVDRTRGDYKGVANVGGNRKTLKEVTKKYAEWRRKQKVRHPDGAKGRRSNLTFTGEMLDKLSVVKASKSNVTIGHKDKKNAAKTEGQEAQGRPYLYLGRSEIAALLKLYDKTVSRYARKV
jgi:hypothetical protein